MGIEGLTYIRDYITPQQEIELMQHIDSQPWDTSLSRRVQHYGHVYRYKHATRNQPDSPLPYEGIIREIGESIDPTFNMCIVNE